MSARFVLEGEWSGYTSSQARIVHREVIDATRAKRLEKLDSIRYTDGTCLFISVRPAKPRERVVEIHSYDRLIREAEASGKTCYVVGI